MQCIAVVLAAIPILSAAKRDEPAWLAVISRSNELIDAGNYVEAERTLQDTYASLTEPEARTAAAGVIAGELGFVRRALGRTVEAEALYRRAVTVLSRSLGDTDPAVLRARCRLVCLYLEEGAVAQAERLLRTGVRPYAAQVPQHSRLAVDIVQNEAALCYRKRQLSEARRLYEVVLTRLGKSPPELQRRSVVLNNIGNVALETGDLKGAKAHMQEAVRVLESLVGITHPEIGKLLMNVAECHTRLKELGDAEMLLKRALTIFSTAFGPDHHYVAFALLRYSGVLAELGRKSEAKGCRKQAQAIMQAASVGPRSRYIVDSEDLLRKR